MSAAHTIPDTAPPASDPNAGSAPPVRKRRTWVVGCVAAGAALVAAVVIATAPVSAPEIARDDGERVGAAVGQLYDAQRAAEVDAALAELDAAVSDTRVQAGDRVGEQAADQRDALARAAEGFVGTRTTDDSFESGLYRAELDTALDDLTSQASDFRAEGPEVQQAFWEGVQEGLPSE